MDTLAASGGGRPPSCGIAVQRARGGASIDEVRGLGRAAQVEPWRTGSPVDDLMFLFHGGRVSEDRGVGGHHASTSSRSCTWTTRAPHPLEKVRGRKKSLHALVDHMEKTAIAPIDQQMVFITHGDCLRGPPSTWPKR